MEDYLVLLIDFEIASWLKETIAGIIILGAFGSILGGIFLWLGHKLVKQFLKVMFHLSNNIFIAILKQYFKFYLSIRGTSLQLINKNKIASIIVLHQRVLSYRTVSEILTVLFAVIVYLNFAFYGTQNFWTSVIFWALLFMSAHDWVLYTVAENMINRHLTNIETEISEETYKNDDVLFLEGLNVLKDYLKENPFDKK